MFWSFLRFCVSEQVHLGRGSAPGCMGCGVPRGLPEVAVVKKGDSCPFYVWTKTAENGFQIWCNKSVRVSGS